MQGVLPKKGGGILRPFKLFQSEESAGPAAAAASLAGAQHSAPLPGRAPEKPQEGRRQSPRERPKPVQRFDHAAEQAREKAATTNQLLKNKQKQKKTVACCRAGRPCATSPCTRCRPSEGEE